MTFPRVLVTGAGSGIGRGVVAHFVRHGGRVVMVDISHVGLQRVASEMGGAVLPLVCDVRLASEMASTVAAAVDELGGLDLVVNAAGVVTTPTPVLELDERELDRVIDVNFKGTFHGIKFGGAALVASGGGSIVNIASIAGMGRSRPMDSAYAASKAAVIAMTQSAALELRDLGVRVNAVCPGMIATPMLAESVTTEGAAPGDIVEAVSVRERQGRLGTPDDIAATIAFLASDGASMITGAIIPIDGGRSAQLDFLRSGALTQWHRSIEDRPTTKGETG